MPMTRISQAPEILNEDVVQSVYRTRVYITGYHAAFATCMVVLCIILRMKSGIEVSLINEVLDWELLFCDEKISPRYTYIMNIV